VEIFKTHFEVRDNEIDAQGVVNNANYSIYYAHARHKYLHELGVSFAQMAEENQNLFLISSSIEFKKPLRAEDKFYVTCKLVPHESSLRFVFEQEIRKPDETLISRALNVGVCLNGNNKNRPYVPVIFQKLLAPNPG
jgi:acyl-CoA thioester hydrolase